LDLKTKKNPRLLYGFDCKHEKTPYNAIGMQLENMVDYYGDLGVSKIKFNINN